jgi:hypothetical protein
MALFFGGPNNPQPNQVPNQSTRGMVAHLHVNTMHTVPLSGPLICTLTSSSAAHSNFAPSLLLAVVQLHQKAVGWLVGSGESKHLPWHAPQDGCFEWTASLVGGKVGEGSARPFLNQC